MSKIAFVGGGNMASCLIGGMLAKGFSKDQIIVCEPSDQARQRLETTHGIKTTADNLSAVSSADILVLAVKPQVMEAVASALAPALGHSPTVVSIAAGIPIAALQGWLAGDSNSSINIVRAMPNTPAMVETGATGLFADGDLQPSQRTTIESMFSAVGFVCWVESETLIDAVTAVSGSGPAYFFLIFEAMQRVGCEMGLDADTALQLTLQTALGAARLAKQSNSSPQELRRQVTSPGGTTQAAIESFQNQHLEQLFEAAMTSAQDRAQQMAAEFT